MARTNTLGNFLTDVADAIRLKKGSSDTILASNFDTEIENLPSGGGATEAEEKDVNFYDHTGFRHYSYTKSEFLALESMPANPEIEGLTAQGWNWSLQDAQDYVADYGKLEIGQMYVTTDGATKIYIELSDERLSPNVGFCINGTATIDWGDNSTPSVVTGTSTNTVIKTNHTYSSGGKYVISVSSENMIYFTGGNSPTNSYIVCGSYGSREGYGATVTKINFGNNVTLKFYFCSQLYNLREVSFPKTTVFNNGNYGLYSCGYIKAVILPSEISNNPENLCSNTYVDRLIFPKITTLKVCGIQNLKKFYISNGVTSFGQATVVGFTSITKLIIPKTITSISNYNFQNLEAVRMYDFSHLTSIPSLGGTNCFTNSLYGDAKIVVPDNLYADWITTNNWSNFSSYIIKKSDWDAL